MCAYKKNLVSVIMPAFNSEQYISDAIDSVLQQTYQNFELIVVNDGSTDRTEDILKKISNSIHLISQSNQGAASARNKGIMAAQGEYISFLDSDDIWFKDTLKLQHEYLTSHLYFGLVYGKRQVFDCKGNLDKNWMIKYGFSQPEGYIFQDLILSASILLSTVMVRRKVLDKVGLFDKSLPLGEDYDLWLSISTKYKIGYIPDDLVKYRRHPKSLTASNYSLKPWDIEVAEKALRIYPKEAKKIPPLLLKKGFGEKYFQSGYDAFMKGQYSIARYRFIKSIALVPRSGRTLRYMLYLIASSFFPQLVHFVIKITKRFFIKKTG